MTALHWRKVLEFEQSWTDRAAFGSKDEVIVRTLGVSPTVYYQSLNAALDEPDALAEYPMLVKRLRRLRTLRRTARAARENRR